MTATMQQMSVAKKASSVASWWKSIFSSTNQANAIPNTTNCACQQVCSAGIEDITSHHVDATKPDGRLVILLR